MRNFLWDLITKLCKTYRINKSHPQGNGEFKRFNHTLHGLLRTLPAAKGHRCFDHHAELLSAYNMTQNVTTGFSPLKLMFLRDPSAPGGHTMGRTSLFSQDKPAQLAFTRKASERLTSLPQISSKHQLKLGRDNTTRWPLNYLW